MQALDLENGQCFRNYENPATPAVGFSFLYYLPQIFVYSYCTDPEFLLFFLNKICPKTVNFFEVEASRERLRTFINTEPLLLFKIHFQIIVLFKIRVPES